MEFICLAQNRVQRWGFREHSNEPSNFLHDWYLLTRKTAVTFSRQTLFCVVDKLLSYCVP